MRSTKAVLYIYMYLSMLQPILIMNKDQLAGYIDQSYTKNASLTRPSINVLYSCIDQLNLEMSKS